MAYLLPASIYIYIYPLTGSHHKQPSWLCYIPWVNYTDKWHEEKFDTHVHYEPTNSKSFGIVTLKALCANVQYRQRVIWAAIFGCRSRVKRPFLHPPGRMYSIERKMEMHECEIQINRSKQIHYVNSDFASCCC